MITVVDAVAFTAFLTVTVAAASVVGIQVELLVARLRLRSGGTSPARRGPVA